MISPAKNTSPLHAIWWFWLPVGAGLLLAVVEQLLSPGARTLMYQEDNFIEMSQSVIAFIAAGYGFACLKHCRGNIWLMLWAGLGAMCCLYIGLEEVSYGQHLFHWQTPEDWKQVNHQWETNLHNTSSWLNEKPKILLWLGVLTGGLLIPLLRWKKPALLPGKFDIIYPDDVLFWPAVLTIYAQFTKFLQKQGFVIIYGRTTEIHESYLYYFVLIYFVLLRLRLKAAPKA